MNEFGETPSFYIWPEGHVEGEPYPLDFYERVHAGLKAVGLECESV